MEKLTVVASEPNGIGNKYDTLLSNGETVVTEGAYPVGVEFVSEADKLRGDNAMLQRGLDDANVTIAGMSTEIDVLKSEIARLEGAQGQMKAPVSLTNVMTRDVADLPPLAALAPAPVMEGQAVGERALSDEEAAERHLAAKRTAAEMIEACVSA